MHGNTAAVSLYNGVNFSEHTFRGFLTATQKAFRKPVRLQISQTRETERDPLYQMTDATDQELEPKTRDFISIGKFIVTFSQIEFFIRHLLSNRLKVTDEHRFNAIVGPYDFAMLCTVTTTILRQDFPERMVEIENIFKQCRALNDHRVRIAHGLWTYDQTGLISRHLSRQSLKRSFYYQNHEELEQLAVTAEKLKVEVLTLCIRLQESGDFP